MSSDNPHLGSIPIGAPILGSSLSRRPLYVSAAGKLAEGESGGALDITSAGEISLRDVLSVRDYGAKGNGTDDDSQAVEDAIAAAAGEKAVYFPAGTYPVSNVQIDNASTVVLVGDGLATILVGEVDPGATVATGAFTAQSTSIQAERFEIRNLNFDCNGANQTSWFAVGVAANAKVFVADSCRFFGIKKTGVWLLRNDQTLISDCEFTGIPEGVTTNAPSGVLVQIPFSATVKSRVQVQGCRFEGPAALSASDQGPAGLNIEGDNTNGRPHHVAVIGNTFRRCGRAQSSSPLGAIDLYTDGQGAIIGNVILEPYGYAVKTTRLANLTVTGNVVTAPAVDYSGFNAFNFATRTPNLEQEGVVVADNVIECGGYLRGMVFEGTSSARWGSLALKGNIIRDPKEFGIRVAHPGQHLMISDCIVDNITGSVDANRAGISIVQPSGMATLDNVQVNGTITNCVMIPSGGPQASGRVTFKGCQFKGHTTSALNLNNIESALIEGCQFHTAGSNAIRLSSVLDAVLVNNLAPNTLTNGATAFTILDSGLVRFRQRFGNSWDPFIGLSTTASPAKGVYVKGSRLLSTSATAGGDAGYAVTTAGGGTGGSFSTSTTYALGDQATGSNSRIYAALAANAERQNPVRTPVLSGTGAVLGSGTTTAGVLSAPVITTAGADYEVGDVFCVYSATGKAGTLTVATVDGTGGITGLTVTDGGVSFGDDEALSVFTASQWQEFASVAAVLKAEANIDA